MRRFLAVLLLLTACPLARSERASAKFTADHGFPGVDEQGLLSNDELLAGAGEIKISLNTKSGKLKESGKGVCVNLSGRAQVYHNPAAFAVGGAEGRKLKLIYKVKANGAAKFRGSVTLTASQEELDLLAQAIKQLNQ